MSDPTKAQILIAARKCGISIGVFDGSMYPTVGQLHAFANEFRDPLLSRIATLERYFTETREQQ